MVEPIPTSFAVLKRTVGVRPEGEIFAYRLGGEPYRFGRVVLSEAPLDAAPMPNSNLVYFYDATSETPTAPVEALTRDRLLIPPAWTNRQGWLRGHWLPVGQQPITSLIRLKHHCFRQHRRKVRYVDETGRRLWFKHEPCSEWGLASCYAIEDEIRLALGLPLIPDPGRDKHGPDAGGQIGS